MQFAWKLLAREMKERWEASLGREAKLEAKLERAVAPARLVVPTNFDARERERIAKGTYERRIAAEEASEGDDAPDAEVPEEDDEDGMREPAPRGMAAGTRLGAKSKRVIPAAEAEAAREGRALLPAPRKKRSRKSNGKTHLFKGELLTVAEIAVRSNISVEGVRKRISRGTLETAEKGKRGPNRPKVTPS